MFVCNTKEKTNILQLKEKKPVQIASGDAINTICTIWKVLVTIY